MICQNCGREIPDGTVCPCNVPVQAPALSSNPALNAIKTLGSSKVFLAAAILYSVSALLSIPLQVFGDLSYDIIGSYTGIDFGALVNSNIASVIVSAVATAVPALLIAVGMWLHFATCRNVTSGNISTAGLTVCKVITVLTLITSVLSAVIVIVALIIVALTSETIAYYLLNTFWYMFDAVYSFDDFAAGLSVIAVLLLVVFAIVFTLSICYNAALLKTINRVKKTALTGVPDNRISRYVVFWNYVIAVITAIGGLVLLFANLLCGLTMLCRAAHLILVSICMSNYRKQATLLMYPPVQPVYAQPVQPVNTGFGYAQPAAPATPPVEEPNQNNDQ